jgi:hypothetical protein
LFKREEQEMNKRAKMDKRLLILSGAAMRRLMTLMAIGASVWSLSASAADVAVALSGAEEVPAVNTTARGQGALKVADDGAVSGNVTTSGVTGTAAHIHSAAAGKNGPVIVPLQKGADGAWSVPSGAKLTPDQVKMFKAGELYVNVHSTAHPDGEIRGQLKP